MTAREQIRQSLREAVAAAEDRLVEITTRLVEIPTENPPGVRYADCASTLRQILEEERLAVETIVTEASANGDEAASCIRSFLGDGERTLYFQGHYDVVPAQAAEQFTPVVRDGRIYGRGSGDMKSGLAAMIVAASALRDVGVTLSGRLGLIFVPDEETGGARGSAWLARAGLLGEHGIGMLSPEPTGGVVWNANRGALSLRLTVRGKSAHVGLRHEGVNAFDGMLLLAGQLRELATEVESRVTEYAVEPQEARRSILLMGGETGGGSNFNTVPDRSWFTVDRRFNPEEDLEVERERLLSVVERLRGDGLEIDVEVLQEGAASGTSEHTDLGVALSSVVAEVTGRAPSFEMCPGLLDSRFYAQQGVPAYCYGAGGLEVAHGPDEHVEIEALVRCATVYALTALDLLT